MGSNRLNFNGAWEKSFTEKSYRIGLHVVFWIVYFFLLQIIAFIITSSSSSKWYLAYSLIDLLLAQPMIALVYYITIRTVYKNIITKGKFVKGVLYLVLSIIIYIHLSYITELWAINLAKWFGYPLPPSSENMSAYLSGGYFHFITMPVLMVQMIFSYFFYMFLPVCCKFLRDQLRLQKNQAALQQKNIQLEMNFLKSQIHPHFLFNTLNNIYSLITHKETTKSAQMVAGLSSLLRYSLYEAKAEFILLEKEITMLKNFIELEEVRSDNTEMTLTFPTELPHVKIPSFLLLPLVENAFKHGANAQFKQSHVKIEMKIGSEELILNVENSFAPEYRKSNEGGLGLANLKKRLNYYYKNNYLLQTKENGKVFTSTLKIPLSCPISIA